MTFDDPKMYTKPFTIKVPHDLLADSDIFEMFCTKTRRTAPTSKNRMSAPGSPIVCSAPSPCGLYRGHSVVLCRH